MDFVKLESAGNDFVLVEAGDAERDWASLAQAMCRRHFGIGADGLLVLLPSKKPRIRMRMFNPDGSEAEICGNGLSCLAAYAHGKGMASANVGGEVAVETAAGVKIALISANGGDISVRAAMGAPRFAAADMGFRVGEDANTVDIKTMSVYTAKVDGMEMDLNLVSMGNPHAVYFTTESVDDFPLRQIGPKVEHLPPFVQRTNFEVAHVLDPEHIRMRVWERGAGETLACGSGACAVAVAAHINGHTGNRVEIELNGGMLGVEWDGQGDVYLSTTPHMVFRGKWTREV